MKVSIDVTAIEKALQMHWIMMQEHEDVFTPDKVRGELGGLLTLLISAGLVCTQIYKDISFLVDLLIYWE